jgi:hypothetical protein
VIDMAKKETTLIAIGGGGEITIVPKAHKA